MGTPGTKATRLRNSSSENVSAENHFESVVEKFALQLNAGVEPEDAYRSLVSIEHRKRHGQFFTPMPIASLMADWILSVQPTSILDPAVGTGVFPRVLLDKRPDTKIVCVDVDGVAVSAARASLNGHSGITVLQQDFLTWPDEQLFDAAIANPPYLRHHDMFYPYDIFSLIGRKNHTSLSRLSNIYVLFILEICRRLRAGGRAAIIVPGEWVNANFGDTLKLWLISRGLLRGLIYFSHASTQFDEALTTASILLLEQPIAGVGRDSIRTVFVHDGGALEAVRNALEGEVQENDPNVVVQLFSPEQLLREKKWNHLLAHGHTQAIPGFVVLSELADTRRGIATGSNSFFHLTPSAVGGLRIRPQNLTRCIGRALDVTGVIFERVDFDRLVVSDSRTYLFDMQTEPDESEAEYLKKGVAERLHERFLCAARSSNWYDMEKRKPSAIWAGVFGREGLRFILNSERVANLTTFHCIYPKDESELFAAALTACLNSRLVQELAQRQHRVYGGGLLKVEPKDLLDVEVPDLRKVGNQTLENLKFLLTKLDTAIRSGAGMAEVQSELDARVQRTAEEAAVGST